MEKQKGSKKGSIGAAQGAKKEAGQSRGRVSFPLLPLPPLPPLITHHFARMPLA